jgi:toxin secretion/phage lysis holin
MADNLKYWICMTGSVIIRLLGGWDIWLTSLFTVIILDIITGIIKASLNYSDKSQNGGLNSSSMFKGGVKKISILIMVALGTVLDDIIAPNEVFIRIMITSYYIANESLSILENINACGVSLPKALYKILNSLKNKSDKH